MANTLNILDHAGDAVCAVNDEKCVIYWNAAAEALLDITADEAAGQPCWKLLKGKTLDGKPFCGPDCPIHAGRDTQEPIPHFDLWVENKNSKPIRANFSTIVIPRQNGRRQPEQAAIIHLIRAVPDQTFAQYDLRLNILGPLTVSRSDGSPINGKYWKRAKVRGLFVLLALKQGKPVAKEELIETLWPDLNPENALRSLNTAVYNLRRSLEPELKQGSESHYIFYEDGFYWLGGKRPHWIDVDAFTLGIQQARLETAVPQAIHLYQEALSRYRGDYLVDLITTIGVGSTVEQARLRQLFLSALEELGNLYQQQEQTEQARNTYLKILSVDPYRESASRQLARLSYGTGTFIDNVAYCQRLAAALKDELDHLMSRELLDRRRQNRQSDS